MRQPLASECGTEGALMKARQVICVAAVLWGVAMFGFGSGAVAAGIEPTAYPAEAAWHGDQTILLSVQTGSRSYMEGRGFQSYRRDRGLAGQRNFGSYPSARGSRREERSYSLKRRRIHGPTDSRCAGWARRCSQDTGDAPGDYESCMRYHGCR